MHLVFTPHKKSLKIFGFQTYVYFLGTISTFASTQIIYFEMHFLHIVLQHIICVSEKYSKHKKVQVNWDTTFENIL